jgi:lysophospholipid acyltransferase (LPLAT)-like uncharacterized protein
MVRMIAIINQNKKNKKGETLYHLKINHEFICDFWHDQSEGLSACLFKAARKVFLKNHMDTKEKTKNDN